MSPLRLCWPLSNEFFKYEDGKVAGAFAPAASVVMETLRGLNISIVDENGIGGLVDSSSRAYDGCLGSMQGNESDYLPVPFLDVPVDGPNLTQGVIDAYERIGIFSMYRQRKASEGTDTHVLDMIAGFSPGLWLLVIVFFIMIAGQLLMSMRVNGKKTNFCMKRTVAALEACVLKQHSGCMSLMPEIRSVLFFYTMMTMFGFFVGFYLTSMIKTEMVVVPPPLTIESYDDLISNGRRPAWMTIFTTSEKFKLAKKGSKEEKVWQTAVRMGINESLSPIDESVMSHAFAIAEEKEVAIMQTIFGKNCLTNFCGYTRSKNLFTDRNTLFRYDDSAEETMQGHVFNHHLHRQTIRYIDRRTQLSLEAGLSIPLPRFISYDSVLGADTFLKHSEIAECKSNVVQVPHPEFTPVNIMHYRSLFWLFVGLLTLSLVFLVFEVYYKN